MKNEHLKIVYNKWEEERKVKSKIIDNIFKQILEKTNYFNLKTTEK